MIAHSNVKVTKSFVLDYVQQNAWAIVPEKLDVIHEVLSRRLSGNLVNLEEIEAAIGKELKNDFGVVSQGGNAVIPVFGVIAKRMNMFQAISGGVSTEILQTSIEAALADPAIAQIVLRVDSPGGTVDGTKELVDFIYASRGQKPIIAYVDGECCSAAYWIASAADQIVAYDTAMVGSIGVVSAHYDYSQAQAKAGVTKTYIYAGKYKKLANDSQPLSKEGKDYLQSFVDTYYSIFVESVARNRGVSVDTVLENMADARLFIGADALKAGLIDKLGALSDVLKGAPAVSKGMAAENSLRVDAYVHNSNVADNEPDWGSVDKTKLPREAFAGQGEAGKRSTYSYPHHWVKDGVMYLHRGGLNAAWSMAHGARSGQKASPEIISHLAAHRKALGLDKNNATITGSDKKEDKIMTLQEIRETYPELVKAVEAEAKVGAENENKKLDAKIAELSGKLEASEGQNKVLSKSLSLLEEKHSTALAESIKKTVLAGSDIPANLHSKIMGMLDHRIFLRESGSRFEEGSEAVASFTEAFKTEVADWEKSLSKAQGVGLGDGKQDEKDTADADTQYGRNLAKQYAGTIRSEQK